MFKPHNSEVSQIAIGSGPHPRHGDVVLPRTVCAVLSAFHCPRRPLPHPIWARPTLTTTTTTGSPSPQLLQVVTLTTASGSFGRHNGDGRQGPCRQQNPDSWLLSTRCHPRAPHGRSWSPDSPASLELLRLPLPVANQSPSVRARSSRNASICDSTQPIHVMSSLARSVPDMAVVGSALSFGMVPRSGPGCPVCSVGVVLIKRRGAFRSRSLLCPVPSEPP